MKHQTNTKQQQSEMNYIMNLVQIRKSAERRNENSADIFHTDYEHKILQYL